MSYPRHFALLACFSVIAAMLANRSLPPTAAERCIVYGALHASALVLALRAPTAIARKVLFAAAAALLCLLTYRAGAFGRALAASFPGHAGLYLPLGLSAAIGAVLYAVAIQRLLGTYVFGARALVLICVGCVLATCAAGFMVVKVNGLGMWCLAVAWWFAFSGGLWLIDTAGRRQQS